MKTKLTLRSIAATKKAQPSQRAYLWDTDLKGFGAYISPTGEVSWLVQKWLGGRGGKAIRSVIGRLPEMTIDQARTQACIALGDLSEGIDLNKRKDEKRQAICTEITSPSFLDAFERYEEQRSTGNRYWKESCAAVRKTSLTKLTMKEITKAHVREVIETKEHKEGHPTAAKNLFNFLRTFFNWAVDQDLLTSSPTSSLKPPKANSRDRVLTDQEIRIFWHASQELGYPFGPFYRLLLLTGQRRTEVASMEWQEVDLSKRLWTIPGSKTKNNKAHLVHLSDLALAEIQSCVGKSANPKGPEGRSFVFSTKQGTHVTGYNLAKAYLDRHMKALSSSPAVQDWHNHDLRRTLASGLAALKHSPIVIDLILNHVPSTLKGVALVYNRYNYIEERKKALDDWSTYVGELVGANSLTAMET